jgi:hypothetical protein
MSAPRPSVDRIVSAALRIERARGGATSELEVVQRITERLYRDLGKLIGAAGFEVLLARALALAARAQPSLVGITAGPGGTLVSTGARSRDDAARSQAATSIVVQFLELLGTLIGDDLTTRLLRDTWPEEDEEPQP